MDAKLFLDILDADYFAGVPDSLLRPFVDCLMERYGVDPTHHVIGANEGNCAALAAGYHLATGRVPVVYLQNSGEGNIVNPVLSLLSPEVYGIPVIFVVGWRGEPGVKDEPQHVHQGKVTETLLRDMGIACEILSAEMTVDELEDRMGRLRPLLSEGRQIAFIVRKGALSHEGKQIYRNDHTMLRETAIRQIAMAAGEGFIVSTTGKASRELFEVREALGQGHERDFLTVGSMGHASSIALGIAVQKPEQCVWCIDGDGAMLMHMGAMALIGSQQPRNLIHVVIHNGAHESVGGMPIAGTRTDFLGIARACGYETVLAAETEHELAEALAAVQDSKRLSFLEVRCAIGARKDLGRPTVSPPDNKRAFCDALQSYTVDGISKQE